MAFFHLRTVPGCRWPPLPDSVFAQAWNAYQELDRTQWLPRAELERMQLKQVRALLAHCLRHVPYYRKTLTAAGIVPASIETMDDFRRIPFLTRRDYQEQTASFMATQLPAGTVASDIMQTSGSSGTPIRVYPTNMVDLWWHAFFLRDLEWCNFDATGVLAVIRNTGKTDPELQSLMSGVSLPYWSAGLDPLIQSGPTHVMEVRQDVRIQLQWLRRIAPDYILSLPANLEVLAGLLIQEGPLPGLKAIQSMASVLTPEAQAVIEKGFGVPVTNTYSGVEAGYMATSCPAGHGLHVHAENILLEVLDADNRPCAPGQTGRIVLTTLNNLRAPFVRYDLGDDASLGVEACLCGRGLPLLARIHGKQYPMFLLPDGQRKHSGPLTVMVRQIGGYWQSQIVQKAPDHVVVRLIIDANWTEQHAERMKRLVQEYFASPIRVDVEIHDRLVLPNSGKFQFVIIEMA